MESNAIVKQYKEVIEVNPQMEGGYFYLAKYFDKIMTTLIEDKDDISRQGYCNLSFHTQLKFYPELLTYYHHHHIYLKDVSFTEGGASLTSDPLRHPLLSEWVCGTADSIPSFSLSITSTSSHVFFGLPGLFCAATLSLHTTAIQSVLQPMYLTCGYCRKIHKKVQNDTVNDPDQTAPYNLQKTHFYETRHI